MTWVFESSRSTGSDRLVLLAIADRTNDEGLDAWPSVDALAAKSRMDVRTVQRSLVRLEALGELRVDRRSGRSSVYTVVMQASLPAGAVEPRPATPGRVSPPADCHPRQSVTPGNLPGRQPCHPTPGNPPGDPSSTYSTSTHTPRARAKAAKGGAVAEGPHRSHAACLDPCCVPAALHRELVRKSGIPDEAEADEQLRAWYREVSADFAGQAVAEDDFAWWRARWKERLGGAVGRSSQRWSPSRPCTERDGIWGEIFAELQLRLRRHDLHTWFGDARAVRDDGELLVVQVPEKIHAEWIRSHYLEALATAADAVRAGLRVELLVAEAA